MKISLQIKNGYITPLDIEKIKSLKDGVYEAKINNMDLRTLNQNRALWLWCEMIATTLNENNLDIKKVLKIDVPWNRDTVKVVIFNTVMEAYYKKKSSTQLEIKEFDKIIDVIINNFGTKYGVVIPNFPHREQLIKESK